jgi:hypothetical protein
VGEAVLPPGGGSTNRGDGKKSTTTIRHQKTTATNNIDDQLSVQTTKQDELNNYMTLMIDAAHSKSMGDLDKLRNVIKERKERIENDAITDHNTKISLLCLPKPSFADMPCRVGDMLATCLRSCRRHGDIACRLECPRIPDISVIS